MIEEATARSASFHRDCQRFSDDVVALRFPPGQFPVGTHDELYGFLQTFPSLLERTLLHVATGEFLDVPDPPLPNLLEDARVLVVHALPILPQGLSASRRGPRQPLHCCTARAHLREPASSGRRERVETPGAVDRLDLPSLADCGANTKGSDSRSPYVPDYVGRGERSRTSDLLVPNEAEGESPKVSPGPKSFSRNEEAG